jgi:hypothetical protein
MFVRNLQVGDVVLLREGVKVGVRGFVFGELPQNGYRPVAYLFDMYGKQWTLHPGDIVELVHRPRPEGEGTGLQKTIVAELLRIYEDLDEARRCGDGVTVFDLDSAVARLLPLMQDYELGKPRKTAGAKV